LTAPVVAVVEVVAQFVAALDNIQVQAAQVLLYYDIQQ
jgi:hypothetical protein